MVVKMWPLEISASTNSYIKMILSENVTYKKHSWGQAFDLKFDVFHMHWPETYLNLKSVPLKLAGTLVVILYLLLLHVLRKKVIWTVHNLKPHENMTPNLSKLSYRIFYYLSDGLIFLSQTSKRDFFEIFNFNVSCKYIKVIPHPLYPVPSVEKVKIDKGVLFFGLMRPYKNIDDLIEKYNKLTTSIMLHLIGSCELNYQSKLLKISGKKINFEFGPYQEARLQQYLNSSIGVVIPYTDITNSGVIFRAMSANINLLLPDIAYTREVVGDLGYESKSFFYKGSITSEALGNFIAFTQRQGGKLPSVRQEHYNTSIIKAHSKLYCTVSGSW